MTTALVLPPLYALDCEHSGCVARSGPAPDEDTVHTVAAGEGWLTDDAGQDWCPEHQADAFRFVCSCHADASGTPVRCTPACLAAQRRAIGRCPVCNRPCGYGTALALDLSGELAHVACLVALPREPVEGSE